MKPNPQEKNKRATNHPPQHHWYEMNRKQRREMIRKIQSEELSLEVIHPDAAGIAIGNESHHASVPPSRDSLQTATTVVSEAGHDMSNWQTESLCVLVAALSGQSYQRQPGHRERPAAHQ